MKTLLVGINSKFIHTNTAIRYLKANCSFPIELSEYTIKDDPVTIAKEIIQKSPDILGFSCYIWNITIISELALIIKKNLPNCIIVFGGPETSYEYDEYLLTGLTDYIMINEGEESFELLLKAIADKTPKDNIPNLAFIKDSEIIRTTTKQIADLNKLNSPYYLEEDILNIPNKIQYVELSRGCPYQCSYCLASLEKGLRYFSLDTVFKHLDYLTENKAKTIKFLDRSFNANKKISYTFFEKLIERDYPNTVFQFEINGDVLDESLITLLKEKCKPNYIRFELGIQSTNNLVNEAVNRMQNTNRLIQVIESLMKTNVILHLDLIAGLPFEDLNSFKNTFNEIFCLHARELQLGFLKLLKGTKIKEEVNIHDYEYSKTPPYEIISNRYITEAELKIIHQVETMLDIYWNKGFMNNSIIKIIDLFPSPFDFFQSIYNYYLNHNLSLNRYQLYDLFVNLISFLKEEQMDNQILIDSLKLDYLIFHNIKPKMFWHEDIKKQVILREVSALDQNLNIDKLYKYATVTSYKEGYLISLYYPDNREILYYNKKESKISSEILL